MEEGSGGPSYHRKYYGNLNASYVPQIILNLDPFPKNSRTEIFFSKEPAKFLAWYFFYFFKCPSVCNSRN